MAIQKETLTKVGVASVAVAVPSAAAFFDPFGIDLAALEVQDEDYIEIDEPSDIDTDGNTSLPSQQLTENSEEAAQKEIKKAQRKRRAAQVTEQRNKKLAKPLLNANSIIYSSLNNPGHCVTDLFKGIETTGFFNTSSVTETITNFTEEEVFKTSQPSFACYTYKEQLPGTVDRKAYVEMAVKSDKEGWVWSAWLTNGGSFQKLWYREYILTKGTNDKWAVKVGHEGEIDPQMNFDKDGNPKPAYRGEFVNNWKNNFKWIKFSRDDAITLRGQDAYWIPKEKGPHKLVDLSVNAGSQITRWASSLGRQRLYEGNNRKRVYKDNKWYSYVPPTNGNRRLIKASDYRLAAKKGEWRQIKDLCSKDVTSHEYETLCLNN